eukprot:9210685-Lingulodinium_polyedra.AAC.1
MDDAVLCPACQFWPRQSQFADHARGKKHRRKTGTTATRTTPDPALAQAREAARSALGVVYVRCAMGLSRACPRISTPLSDSACSAPPPAAEHA